MHATRLVRQLAGLILVQLLQLSDYQETHRQYADRRANGFCRASTSVANVLTACSAPEATMNRCAAEHLTSACSEAADT